MKSALITVAKVRALHYPRKLRVTNSKHLDNITPVLEGQIGNDSFWLLLLDFTTSFHIVPKTLLLHQTIHPESLPGW